MNYTKVLMIQWLLKLLTETGNRFLREEQEPLPPHPSKKDKAVTGIIERGHISQKTEKTSSTRIFNLLAYVVTNQGKRPYLKTVPSRPLWATSATKELFQVLLGAFSLASPHFLSMAHASLSLCLDLCRCKTNRKSCNRKEL